MCFNVSYLTLFIWIVCWDSVGTIPQSGKCEICASHNIIKVLVFGIVYVLLDIQ